MFFSMRRIKEVKISGEKKRVILLFLMNYVLLTVFIYATSHLLVSNPDHLNGLIMFALAPPAILAVVISLTFGFDTLTAAVVEIIAYVFALFFIPLMSLFLFGSMVDVFEMFKLLVLMIIIPLVLSRLLSKSDHRIFEYDKIIVNIMYCISFYVVIGLNINLIFTNFLDLIGPAIEIFLIMFVLGSIIYFVSRKFGLSKENSMLYTVFGTFKNGGITIGLALFVLSEAATVPMVFLGLFRALSIFYYKFLQKNF